jgi:hypothetical protein
MYIDVRCMMNDVLFYDGISDGVNVSMLYWMFLFYYFIVIMFGYVILMLYVCIMIK